MGLCMRLHILAVQAQIELLLLPRVCLEHEGLQCKRKKKQKTSEMCVTFTHRFTLKMQLFYEYYSKNIKEWKLMQLFCFTSVSNVSRFFFNQITRRSKNIAFNFSTNETHGSKICGNGKGWQVSTVFKKRFRRHPGDTVHSQCCLSHIYLDTYSSVYSGTFLKKYCGISRDLMWDLRSAFTVIHLATFTHLTEQKVIHAVGNQGE